MHRGPHRRPNHRQETARAETAADVSRLMVACIAEPHSRTPTAPREPTSPRPAPERSSPGALATFASTARALGADGLRYPAAALVGVFVYVLAAPLLAIVHQAAVLAAAGAMSGLAWAAASSGAIQVLPVDPIYTSALLLTLGGIEIRGLAVAGPVGATLNWLAPGPFQPPELAAAGAWASAVVEPGATVASRLLSGLAADAAMLGFAILAVRRGLRGRLWLAAFGAVIQARVVLNHLIAATPELRDLEAAGIPFAIAMVVSGDVLSGPRLAERLAALPEPTRDLVVGAAVTALAYGLAFAFLLAPGAAVRTARLGREIWRDVRFRGRATRLRLPAPLRLHRPRITERLIPRASLAMLAVGVAVSPLGSFAAAETHYLSAPDAPASDAGAAASPTDFAVALPVAGAQHAPLTSTVVVGSNYRYSYLVNGKPTVIRGMGYNVQYAHLDPAERVWRLNRDFAAIRKAGVNTIFGWATHEFDEVLLDAAQAHGLGVAPPFDLDPDADYADPLVRQRLKLDVLRWIERYRHHPAVRMWAIGNEVLHKLVYPSWMPIRSAPEWEARARAFASFLVEVMDAAHLLDPNHPIIHRDAEDAYLSWLRDAMADGRARPWFVYGINSYTPRLAQILGSWPGQGFDVALLVSEFAPGGMGPAERPQGFRSMWRTIRAAQGKVIGGAVYAWTTNGPEEVDRVFGLVDGDGNPVDGSLATIGAMFRGVEREEAHRVDALGGPVDRRVLSFARDAIVTLQDGRGADLLPAGASTSIMGNLDDIPAEPVRDSDVQVVKVRDPHRVAWQQGAGIGAEWWITWHPKNEPYHKVTFLVQEKAGGALQVGYIYHGPR